MQYTVLEPEDAQLGFIHENGTPDGWKDAGGTPYTPGESIALSDSITLYAQWEGIWEGTGTAEDPYQIPNGEKLRRWRLRSTISTSAMRITGSG